MLMSMVNRAKRARYVWGWRLRYWWLDTESGAAAHVATFCIAVLVVMMQLIQMGVAELLPLPPGEPVRATPAWVVQLIIMVIAAAVSYALRPRPENAKPPQEAAGPTTEDGQSVGRFWGTCWFDDQFLLAWKIVGRDPIRAEGGK